MLRSWIRLVLCLGWIRQFSNAFEFSPMEIAALEGSVDLRWVRGMVLDNYSMVTPPFEKLPDGNASAVRVYCIFQPRSITSISVKTMDFDVDLDMNIYWVDPRLYIPPTEEDETPVVVPRVVGETLWWPRIKFRNCKGCHEFVVDRTTHVITMANPKRRELLVEDRKVFKFICTFDLAPYPFDTQSCFIRMESLTATDRVQLIIHDAAFEDDFNPKDINVPPEFTLVSYSVSPSNKCASSSNTTTLGVRDCIEYLFTVKRSIANHLMLIYGPSLLIVMLSWISFWLDIEASPPRVALGLTSLLTLATQFNAAQNNLPSVAAVKAIDIWMFCCIFMVFASLIEFAIANFQFRLRKSLSINTVFHAPAKPRFVMRFDVKGQPQPVPRPRKPHCLTGVQASPADRIARVVFPLTFLLFNIIYWSSYL